MRASLAELNFREIVDYGGQPDVMNRYPRPLDCKGYCVDCEESGVLQRSGGSLTLMSHGCDSSDFEAILGPMPLPSSRAVSDPVLFLLENPGGDGRYCNGRVVPFRGYAKKPPVNHYYWTPDRRPWPQRISDFIGHEHFYGPYFAYLMQRHALTNVYITNVAKCKWTGPKAAGAKLVADHCAARFLAREIATFAPRTVFVFGRAAETGLKRYQRTAGSSVGSVYLWHPSYIKDRAHAQGFTKQQLLEENDTWIASSLSRLG